MKKLITLLLVLAGYVGTVSADDQLTTVYLKPGTNWSQSSARFALYMFDSSGTNEASWFSFINISDGLYYALYNKTKYDKMILCRMNGENETNSFDVGVCWNKSADLAAPSASTPVYTIGDGDWDGGNYTGVSIDASGNTIHKIYVQDKEATGQTPYFYEYQNGTWLTIDNAWPGQELTTEVVEGKTWYVFKTLKTSVLGRFMQAWNNGSNFAAGGTEFDLSDGDLQYNYYPSAYQAVLTSEALATPAVLHFRSNNGASPLKHYFWNSDGINDEGFTTTAAGATDWVTITTYKPALSIQFYTYDNGGTDTDKSDPIDITGLTGGENYYYFAKLNANNATGDYQYDGKGIMKMQDSYYLVYADGWDFDPSKETYESSGIYQTVGAIQLTANAENDFLFEGTLDNTDGKKNFYAIVPASDWSGTAITEWNNLISPSHPASTDNKFTIAFEIDECDAMPTTWTRWYNPNVNTKIDIAFNFATMTWESKPYAEVEIGETGYATYSNDNKYKVENATANFVTVAGKVATLVPQDASAVLPNKAVTNAAGKNSGIVLTGTPSTTAIIRAVASDAVVVDGVSDNLMAGSGNATYDISDKFAGDDLYTAYILANHESVLGFYKVNLGYKTLAAHKAFLAVPTGAGAPEFLGFGADVTGINEVKGSGLKVQDAVVYDLQGRRVITPARGLYIVNGRKVVIK